MAGLSLCSVDSHFVIYFILHSFSNKESITIASICLYASCSDYIPTAIADPMQNNKSVKALLTHNVQKIQYSGWDFMSNTALGFASCCIHHSTPPLILYFPYTTLNGALTYTYYEPTSLCRLQRLAKWFQQLFFNGFNNFWRKYGDKYISHDHIDN